MKPIEPLTKERKGSLYTLVAAVSAIGLAFLLKLIMPDFTGQPSFGIYSVIPAVFLILYIFFTKRIFEALILASLIGYIMAAPFGKSINAFSTGLMDVMMSKDIAWLFMVCGLMGSIIAMGVNVALAVSAVISAGVFGSHICFYSDATVITSAATGCDNFAHAKTQIPYGLLAAAITMILYLIAGFIF